MGPDSVACITCSTSSRNTAAPLKQQGVPAAAGLSWPISPVDRETLQLQCLVPAAAEIWPAWGPLLALLTAGTAEGNCRVCLACLSQDRGCSLLSGPLSAHQVLPKLQHILCSMTAMQLPAAEDMLDLLTVVGPALPTHWKVSNAQGRQQLQLHWQARQTHKMVLVLPMRHVLP